MEHYQDYKKKNVRRLLLTASDYCLNDRILHHSRVAKSKRTQEMTVFQLVLPQALITKIVRLYHKSPLVGHMGAQQTIDNLRENLYFSRPPSIVSDFVRSCPDCQERKMTKAHTKTGIISYRTISGLANGFIRPFTYHTERQHLCIHRDRYVFQIIIYSSIAKL